MKCVMGIVHQNRDLTRNSYIKEEFRPMTAGKVSQLPMRCKSEGC